MLLGKERYSSLGPQGQGEVRRTRLSDVRRQAGHREGYCGVLPKVCGRGHQEGDQGYPSRVRQDPVGRRPKEVRAKEVRR